MKTKTIILSVLLALPMWVLADDCTTIWTGSKALDLTNGTLFIGKAQFATAQPGNLLRLSGNVTGEGDHYFYFADYDTHPLSGTYKCFVGELPQDVFLTEDMIELITTGNKDLRIYGEGITVTSVQLCNGKAGNLHFGKTIWTGYSWIPAKVGEEQGSATLELYKQAIPADLSGYKALRIFHTAARTTIAFNIIKDDWEEEDVIARSSSMTKTNTYYDLPLTDALRTALTSLTTQLNIQGFSDGEGYNITDVIFIPNDPCDNCFYYQY